MSYHHAFNQSNPQHQGNQAAAAIADERQRNTSYRDQVQIDGYIHHRLEENKDGYPIGDHGSEGIARQARRAQSAIDNERQQDEHEECTDEAQFFPDHREDEIVVTHLQKTQLGLRAMAVSLPHPAT